MDTLPWLSITIFLPLVGAFFILFIQEANEAAKGNIRSVALLTSLTVLGLACIDFSFFRADISDFQLVESYGWLENFKSQYHVGVDGISILFVLLTAFLMPLVILSTWVFNQERVKEYMIAFLVLETMMLGTFCALDLILFYLFFEAVLIPMYLIIGIWGGKHRIYASYKFFLYTLLGSILMLVAILILYQQIQTTEIDVAIHHTLPVVYQKWLWLAFFASFAIKIPMWPVHTWLPDAHVEAPTAGSVILAAILLKMGGYGFLRFSLPMFPEACQYFAPLVYGLSLIGIIYTSLVALVQTDMKKLVAYSSIAHMSFVTFGIFTFSVQGLQGAVFQMISHGLISGGLFLSVGVLYNRCHTRDIDKYGGVVQSMPKFAIIAMIFILGSLGLPGTSGFIGEILVMIAAVKIHGLMAFCLSFGIVLSAAYGLRLYRRVFLGKAEEKVIKLPDLTPIETLTLVPLAMAVVVLGLYPNFLFNISKSTVDRYVQLYETKSIKVQTPTQTSTFIKTEDS